MKIKWREKTRQANEHIGERYLSASVRNGGTRIDQSHTVAQRKIRNIHSNDPKTLGCSSLVSDIKIQIIVMVVCGENVSVICISAVIMQYEWWRRVCCFLVVRGFCKLFIVVVL